MNDRDYKNAHEAIILTWFLILAKIIVLAKALFTDGAITKALTSSNIDLAITCIILHFMYKRSTLAFACALVYFMCNQLIKMADAPTYIIILLMGLYFYLKGLYSCNRINRERGRTSKYNFLRFIIFLLFTQISMTSVYMCYNGASSQMVVNGQGLNRIKRQILLSHRLLSDPKELVYFYSPYNYIEEGGLLLNKRNFVSYQVIDDGGYVVNEVNYSDIESIEFHESKDKMAIYYVGLKSGNTIDITLPLQREQSEFVLKYIGNRKNL